MKKRPILFSGAMVRALLDGSKTQTRRIVKPRPDFASALKLLGGPEAGTSIAYDHMFGGIGLKRNAGIAFCQPNIHCPYGYAGDRLWVRETWQYADWTDCGEPHIGYAADGKSVLHEEFPEDWAKRLEEIWCELSAPANFDIDNRAADRRWRPSIHMPRWACRLLLDVVAVRVEHLQDISAEDAIAEGLSAITKDGKTVKYGIPDRDGFPGSDDDGWHWNEWEKDPIVAFGKLWEKINGAGSWAANPWVWVVEFKRAENNVEADICRNGA
ncbi:hypothetical protein [Herbaspirillum sp. NPDC101397]|uniref:hypothetical protein n=1 Tax=Herbaspirillum sp. NPDC101397 TaxID=3364006 RepID=UPI00383A9425